MFTRREALVASGAAGLVAATAGSATAQSAFKLPEKFNPREVRVDKDIATNTIIIVTGKHFLYHVGEKPGKAVRYGVGVGRAGLEFKGTAVIGAKKEWPSWTPTQDMIRREPENYAQWADGMPGGPKNPLGARALYLFQNGADTFFRIHGTTVPRSIGTSVSNGCIRMINEHVTHLYDRTAIGTKVIVV
ncbi:MAG: L,D-transpeptidase family protein [Rhodobacteraceae bacterium]|nr:L,D-transpeptidase family protein [Paracoccaceae bacterium]